MNEIFYGIRRLALINTKTYSLGDFPLDKPLSISGANNRGKSTAINALQFPFLSNMSDMSFPKNNDDTRKYYFPYDNSYVLVEVVTEAGTFVIGAAGKGQASGFEYQLFAYKSNLDLTDFTIDTGGEVQQIRNLKELSKHLASKNTWVKQLTPKQMRGALMGQSITLAHDENFTIGIFRLRNMTDAYYKLFIRVFKNLLHMKDVNFEEIKRLLIDILLPSQASSSIDFMTRYRLLMEEVDQAKNKADTASKIAEDVRNLIEAKKNFDENCGVLHALFPKITISLESEKQKRENEILELKNQINAIAPEIKAKENEYKLLHEENKNDAINENDIKKKIKAIAAGDVKYTLSPSLEAMETELQIIGDNLNKAIGELQRTKPEDIENIRADLKDNESDLKAIRLRLSAINNNVLFLLKTKYDESQLQLIAKLINTELLSSVQMDEKSSFLIDKEKLFDGINKLLSYCKGEIFNDGKIQINLQEIHSIELEDYFDYETIITRQNRLDVMHSKLNRDLKIATEYKEMEQKKKELESNHTKKKEALKQYEKYLSEKEQEEVINKEFLNAKQKLEQSSGKLAGISKIQVELGKKKQDLENVSRNKSATLDTLMVKYKKIKPLNSDDGLGILPSYNLPTALEDMVDTYILADENASKEKNIIQNLMSLIENKDGLRFTTGNKLEASIIELSDAVGGLSDFEKVVEDKQKALSVEIGALLKELRNRYLEFEHEIIKFNKQMNRHKISNLKHIKFVIDSNNEILRLINTLVDQGSTFGDPNNVHDAVKRLDHMITRSGVKLSLENLFNLGIEVKLENNEITTSFDSANIESTGTGLTVKVILNVILLKKLMHVKTGQLTNIPIYIDEAQSIDPNNQETLIEQCLKSGFVPVLAAVEGQSSADYWIGIEEIEGRVYVDQSKWFKLKKLNKQVNEIANA
ncbi:MAG: hypothetical protein KAH20_10690 [Methylococcales bacterium]|nr:hypothetical protein [Methylococcales bacterium]